MEQVQEEAVQLDEVQSEKERALGPELDSAQEKDVEELAQELPVEEVLDLALAQVEVLVVLEQVRELAQAELDVAVLELAPELMPLDVAELDSVRVPLGEARPGLVLAVQMAAALEEVCLGEEEVEPDSELE